MRNREAVAAFARLELAEALRSRWLAFTAAAYAVIFGAFVWLGLRESAVLGFTGLSRVVLNVSNALIVSLPLVVLASTSQTIVRGKSSGLFELVLTQPCRRSDWLSGLVLSRVVVLLGPLLFLLVLAVGVDAFGARDATLVPMVLRSAAVSGGLVWAFLGLGVFLSSVAKTPERSVVYALVAWLATSALHDFALIGALLRWRMSPKLVFALAAVNPVESARIAILSGVDPDLSVLGPVGFWIANSLGPTLALSLGIGWPVLLGTGLLLAARRRFEAADLVG